MNNNNNNVITSIIHSLTLYFEETHQLFSSFNSLQASHKLLFDMINGRFELFDIIIRDFIQSNNKRRKKYYDLYQEETFLLLEKTSIIFHNLHKELPFNYENIEKLSKELIFQVESLKNIQNNDKNLLLQSISKRNTVRKKGDDEEITDVISSRRDLISSNRQLISNKTKAFNSVLNKEGCMFSREKIKYFNENHDNKSLIVDNQEVAIKNDYILKENNNNNVKFNEKFNENIEKVKNKKKNNMFSTQQERKIILELMKKEYPHAKKPMICHEGSYFS